jgi:hypothetical protein
MCKAKMAPIEGQKCKNKIHSVNEQSDSDSDIDITLMNFMESNTVSKVTVQPIAVTIIVNGISVNMELDSGSPVSLMPKVHFDKYFQATKLNKSDIRLATFMGEQLDVCGYLPVVVGL